MPQEKFEAVIEAPKPATVTQLAEMRKQWPAQEGRGSLNRIPKIAEIDLTPPKKRVRKTMRPGLKFVEFNST